MKLLKKPSGEYTLFSGEDTREAGYRFVKLKDAAERAAEKARAGWKRR